MSESTTKPPPEMETWTMEDVQQWLKTVVKVHQTCADKFIEKEVSGEALAAFKRKDILDLGIKYGPAVKIITYLKKQKEGSQHESQFPAHVENWTKEEVNQWLRQQVKVDAKKAKNLMEEDVSGDCLVCFKKQDFLGLQLKRGSSVKILKELDRLKNTPEPTLNPTRQISTDQEESQEEKLPPEKLPGKKETPEEKKPTTPQEANAPVSSSGKVFDKYISHINNIRATRISQLINCGSGSRTVVH